MRVNVPRDGSHGDSSCPISNADALLDSLRRGLLDTLTGCGPLDGELLMVKAYRLEEKNRALMEQLARRSKELGEFALTTAHGLREPLASIEDMLRVLLRQTARTELSRRSEGQLREIEHAAVRMRLLVADLMALGRSGAAAEPVQRVDLLEVSHAVLDGYRRLIARDGVRVEVDPSLPVVDGRLRDLETVVENLVANAIQHGCGAGGAHVEISCAREGDELVVSVADDGSSFDPSEAETVYEPYRRLDERGRGTGLGLTIVRIAIERHAGRTWIEPRPGCGTVAYFTLPNARPTQDHARSDGAPG